jgi:dipeptide/tripeptide permease
MIASAASLAVWLAWYGVLSRSRGFQAQSWAVGFGLSCIGAVLGATAFVIILRNAYVSDRRRMQGRPGKQAFARWPMTRDWVLAAACLAIVPGLMLALLMTTTFGYVVARWGHKRCLQRPREMSGAAYVIVVFAFLAMMGWLIYEVAQASGPWPQPFQEHRGPRQ